MSYSIAHTIPEEDHENYITEDEAIEMIKGFNTHLKNLSIQMEELKKSNLNLSKKISKEVERNSTLRASVSESRKKLEGLDKEKELKSQQLAQLELKIESESTKIGPNNLLNFKGVEELIEINDSGSEFLSYLEQLESCSIIFRAQKELLEKKLGDKYLQNNSEIKCVKCREKYIPAKNGNKACAYHPGKLRYFSCRGCGGDPYYDCCSKCKNCSKGCKVTHHIS